MLIVIFGIAFLLLGYIFYSRLPAMFMMMVSLTFIMSSSSQGFGLDLTVSLIIAAIVTAVVTAFYIRVIRRDLEDLLKSVNREANDGEI